MRTISVAHGRFLTLVKWLAALMVLFGHLRRIIFEDFRNIEDPAPLDYAFYLVTSISHEAVIVFFVLSGYLVGHYAFLKDFRNIDVCSFCIKRIARIYTVLIPALAFTVFVTITLEALPTLPWDLSEHGHSVLLRNPPTSLSTLIGNIFGLQGVVIPAYGLNLPLWSLGFELFFYAFVVVVMYSGWRTLTTGFVLITFILNPYFVFCLGLFLLGAFARTRKNLAIFSLTTNVKLVGVLGSMISCSILNYVVPGVVSDLILAVCVTFFFYVDTSSPASSNVRAEMLDYSYTLYLFHYPLTIKLIALVEHFFGFGYGDVSALSTYLLFFIMTVTNVVFAFFLYQIFERRTPKIVEVLNEYFASWSR